MDSDQENMQSLGLLGIYKESCKLIFSYWKIFTKITLALILPLSFIYLARLKVYDLLNKKIWLSLEALDCTEVSTSHNHKPFDLVSSEWTYFILLDTIILTFFYILSLLSSVTVVGTIACIYTARDVTFMKAVNVIPMVWKWLMITSPYLFGTIVAYSTVAGLVIVSIASFLGATNVICLLIILVSLILYLVGLIYLSTIWNLANVVSILEESYGAQAMVKSRTLMRGKILITMREKERSRRQTENTGNTDNMESEGCIIQRRKPMESPNKKSKSGARFGFVRFLNVHDKRELERQLDQIWIGDWKLWVNSPRYDDVKKEEKKEGKGQGLIPKYQSRSYAEVLRGNGAGNVEGVSIGAMQNKAAGKKVRAIGGNMVLLDCDEKEELKDLVEMAANWLGQWFKEVKPWTPELVVQERFVWIKCHGAPLDAWTSDFFEKMGCTWGKFICLDDRTSNKRIFDVAKLLISTHIMDSISVTRQIKINGVIYNVKFKEEEFTNNFFSLKQDFLPSFHSGSEENESWSWDTDKDSMENGFRKIKELAPEHNSDAEEEDDEVAGERGPNRNKNSRNEETEHEVTEEEDIDPFWKGFESEQGRLKEWIGRRTGRRTDLNQKGKKEKKKTRSCRSIYSNDHVKPLAGVEEQRGKHRGRKRTNEMGKKATPAINTNSGSRAAGDSIGDTDIKNFNRIAKT
ncbi:hypothetical protein SLEP1_g4536 [Rubroshorea leprosula]|uniref:DUF4283 domain-containing protein n=1 Tax=Rubroshorea leprosula TaxID=152421 RepID=A0AAV5HXV2_9ROSI|nr:hypothetical protein SLEP1_g4536 [Rubroshorea leprosula]